MNVLFLDQYSDLGGAQRCLLDLIPAVQQTGGKAVAGVPGGGPLVAELRDHGVRVEPIPCKSYPAGHKGSTDKIRFAAEQPKLASAIRGLIESSQPDLVYVNGPRVLPAAVWAARSSRPLLFHCHSHLTQASAAWVTGRALRSCGATVVACCRFAASPILPHIRQTAFYLVDNGVPAPPPRDITEWSQHETRIGVIGRISPEKGQVEFLRAARLLSKSHPDWRFIICGDALFDDPTASAYRGKLDELANGLPVEFLGWRSRVDEVLAELDLLVVPSTQEPGAPRVILEAYAAGVPVIAFATGGIPEILFDGDSGFLVDPPTPEALSARIMTLVSGQPDHLEAAAKRGRSLWRERFTLERYRHQLLEIMARAAGIAQPPHELAPNSSTPAAGISHG